MSKIKVINPYDDIDYIDLEPEDGGEDLTRVRSLQVGFGSKVLRIDQDGLWMGAERFADAPFKVDMLGNMTATSLDLSAYLQVGQALADVQSDIFDLSDIDTDLGVITAGTLIGLEVRGGEVKTSSSGARVVMDGATDALYIYDVSAKRMQLDNDEITFYNSSAAQRGGIKANTTEVYFHALNGGNLHLEAEGSLYTVIFTVGGVQEGYFSTSGLTLNDVLTVDDSIVPSAAGTVNLGASGTPFEDAFIDDLRLTAQTSNPTSNGMVRYYSSGGTEGLRMQLGGSDFQFDATGV